MSAPSSPRLRAWAPHLAVVLWLVFLGAAVWWHAARSEQAPMWDPYSYLVKAKNFWDCIARGELCNPLDLQPTARPPGTILVSYPFGFSSRFSGYHFRSVYLPVLCMGLAPYLALGFSRAFTWGWGTCASVLLFTSLPMFYHFEWTRETLGTGGWGMMDGFLSGITALAGALFVRGLAAVSLSRLAAGAVLAAGTLFIKPAGAAVMALLAALWAFLAGASWLRRRADGSRRAYLLRFALPGGLLVGGIFVAAAGVCRFSGYLSPDNFEYARKALAFERTLPGTPLAIVLGSLRVSVGVFLPLWAAAVALLSLASRGAGASDDDGGIRPGHLVICALAILATGAWYWFVVQVLASQVRYFWPFVCLAVVCLLPVAWTVWRSGGRAVRTTLLALCVLPAVSLAVLLPLKQPPAGWQKIAGVHLDVGTSREAEEAARTFLSRLPGGSGTARIYTFPSDTPVAVFEHVIHHELLVTNRMQAVGFQHAYDWIRGFVIRTGDILDADFILFAPISASDAQVGRGSDVPWTGTFDEETQAFNAWVSSLGEEDGLRSEIEAPALRLSRIIDKRAFERSMARFVGSRSWRPQFKAENPRRWWSAAEMAALAGRADVPLVRLGKQYLVHAVVLGRTPEALTIELGWEALRPDPPREERSWFFHLLDRDGKIVGEVYRPLQHSLPLDPAQPVRLEQLRLELGPKPTGVKLGFGIYAPKSGRLLQADAGIRDWRGRRVLLPLNSGDAPSAAAASISSER